MVSRAFLFPATQSGTAHRCCAGDEAGPAKMAICGRLALEEWIGPVTDRPPYRKGNWSLQVKVHAVESPSALVLPGRPPLALSSPPGPQRQWLPASPQSLRRRNIRLKCNQRLVTRSLPRSAGPWRCWRPMPEARRSEQRRSRLSRLKIQALDTPLPCCMPPMAPVLRWYDSRAAERPGATKSQTSALQTRPPALQS